ncbi:hypothetical protein VaNZ11_003047 [Volvox africanus]|uniref:Uncharacterized protein n=1 Tax=Volvox africanus TaxID=51714 RepID=A0ABQ5RTQ5_9CHLO|nr:hypothetical protein VaNZ11_003047 [Volvox africanus]
MAASLAAAVSGTFDTRTRQRVMQDLVQAVVDRSVVEYCVRSLLLPIEQLQTAFLPPTVSSTTTIDALATGDSIMMPETPLCRVLSVVGLLIRCSMDHKVGGSIFSGSTGSGAPSGSDQELGGGSKGSDSCKAGVLDKYQGYDLLQTLLSGTNLQFGIAYIVSQLAALDGGPSYGLEDDSLAADGLLERARGARADGRGVSGGRYSSEAFHCLMWSFASWDAVNLLSVQFPLFSTAVVLKLSFRALRMVTAAAADLISQRQPRQQRQRGEAEAQAFQILAFSCGQLAVVSLSSLRALGGAHSCSSYNCGGQSRAYSSFTSRG